MRSSHSGQRTDVAECIEWERRMAGWLGDGLRGALMRCCEDGSEPSKNRMLPIINQTLFW